MRRGVGQPPSCVHSTSLCSGGLGLRGRERDASHKRMSKDPLAWSDFLPGRVTPFFRWAERGPLLGVRCRRSLRWQLSSGTAQDKIKLFILHELCVAVPRGWSRR